MVSTVYIERQVADHPRTKAILERFKHVETVICERYSEVFNPKSQNFRLQKLNPSLILAHKHKAYVLPTPDGYGVGGSENFYFSHMLNCVYDCRYCFLQGMYASANYVVYVNYEDFTDSIVAISRKNEQSSPWFFSGYDCDSLAYEPITGFMQHCLSVFETIPTSWLEIRTKSTQVRSLLNRHSIPNVVVAFSFTPDDFSNRYEQGVPAVEKRIEAMAALQNRGWKIGLRFDPMMAYQDYQQSYKQLFEQIFTRLDSSSVHSASMGEFRMPKDFYKKIKGLYPEEPLYHLPMDDTNGMKSYNQAQQGTMFDFCREQLLRWLPESKLYRCSI